MNLEVCQDISFWIILLPPTFVKCWKTFRYPKNRTHHFYSPRWNKRGKVTEQNDSLVHPKLNYKEVKIAM
jgi:hypothetical protein